MPTPREQNRLFAEEKKKFADAVRKLDKEKSEWRIEKAANQRDSVHLKSLNSELLRKNEVVEQALSVTKIELETESLRSEALRNKNNALEVENRKLEASVADNLTENVKLLAQLEAKKAVIDQELEDYSLARKKEIKTDILATHDQLVVINTELQQRTSELESIKTQLGQINQVFVDEQNELKASSAETAAVLAANKEKIVESVAELEKIQEEIKELQYRKDNDLITMARTKEEHEKFIEYERQARKVLDAKDRQLQEKAAEIAEQKQFLGNSRSFLSEL